MRDFTYALLLREGAGGMFERMQTLREDREGVQAKWFAKAGNAPTQLPDKFVPLS